MAENRKRNAIIKYEIAAKGETPTYLELAKYITDVDESSNDRTEEVAYYDGDGTMEPEIIETRYIYEVTGYRDTTDAAQNLIVGLRHEVGEARKILLKVTKLDGSTETGEASVSNIKDGGGNAGDYAPFSCTISRTAKPTVTAGSGGT